MATRATNLGGESEEPGMRNGKEEGGVVKFKREGPNDRKRLNREGSRHDFSEKR